MSFQIDASSSPSDWQKTGASFLLAESAAELVYIWKPILVLRIDRYINRYSYGSCSLTGQY